MSARRVETRQLCGAGGAELTGLDLRTDADADVRAEALVAVREALQQHLVVTIPAQQLDDAELVDLAKQLGPLGVEPFMEGESTHPHVVAVVKEADEVGRYNFGGSWHSDWSFLPTPPSFTLLHARETPPVGGDTWFANQHLAFESLSSGMQRLVAGLSAVHSGRRTLGPLSVLSDPAYFRSMKVRTGPEAFAEQAHPAVRAHAQTRRAALYVNPVYTIRFADMTEPESAPLLRFLHEHSVRPEFVVRVAWRPGTLTIWDNRALMHLAVNDYDGFRREMRRVTVQGEAPQPMRT